MTEEHTADPWDETAASWDSDEGPRRYAAAARGSLADIASAHGVDVAKARVLDFGCGTGLLAELLAGEAASIVGIDTSNEMLRAFSDKVERNGWAHITLAAEIPSDGEFDLVVCSSVCSFLDDYPGTVAKLTGLLAPGGLFVQWDWERAEDSDADDHGLTRTEVAAALDDAGLTNVAVGTAFTVEVDEYVMSPIVGSGRRPR